MRLVNQAMGLTHLPSALIISHQSFFTSHISLLLLGGFARRTLRTLRTEEDLLSVRERQVAAVGAVGPIFRLVTIDEDLGSDGKRTLRESPTEQGIRCSAFNHPPRCRSIGILDVNVDPGVRIDQLHFLHGATKLQ